MGRAVYIDQSQSLNIHLSEPSFSKITSMHFYAWKCGLKTGMYYLRTKPAVDAIKFTLNVEELLKATEANDCDSVLKCIAKIEEEEKPVVSTENTKSSETNPKLSNPKIEEPEICINCSG